MMGLQKVSPSSDPKEARHLSIHKILNNRVSCLAVVAIILTTSSLLTRSYWGASTESSNNIENPSFVIEQYYKKQFISANLGKQRGWSERPNQSNYSLLQAAGGLKATKSFLDTILNIPWNSLKSLKPFKSETVANWRVSDVSSRVMLQERTLMNLLPVTVAEPLVPANQTCHKPAVIDQSEYTSFCSKTDPNIFSGKVLQKSRRLGYSLLFGFEADVLEILLHEIYDLVDVIFISESIYAHNMVSKKPLVWEYLRTQARFQKFLPKIVHFILDGQEAEEFMRNKTTDIWLVEGRQANDRFEKIRSWIRASGFLQDDDLVALSHADEIPARRNLDLLRHCQLKPGVSEIGTKLWFPWSRLDTVYFGGASDPPYAYISSAFYRVSKLMDSQTRLNHERVEHYVNGGMHASDSPYAPFMFIKRFLVCSECQSIFDYSSDAMPHFSHFSKIFSKYKSNRTKELRALEEMLIAQPKRHIDSGRLVKLSEVTERLFTDEIYYVPWFLKCNLLRYPGWIGLPDSRLLVQF